jgi:hypothetical protein
MATESIFWFHPLICGIGSKLVDERERACDVRTNHDGNLQVVHVSPVKFVSGVTGFDLKKRIEVILRNVCEWSFERPLPVSGMLKYLRHHHERTGLLTGKQVRRSIDLRLAD